MQRSRKLFFAVSLLLLIHVLVLGAGFFSPYDPDVQNHKFPFAPPMPLHWVDVRGKLHFRPFVYPWVALPGHFAAYRPDFEHPVVVHFFVRDAACASASAARCRLRLFGTASKTPIFLLGTDEYGRDQFSRMLYGAQVSLLGGFTAAMLSVCVGLMLGSLAGFYGGWIDGALMRMAELFLALPWLYVLFAFRAFLPLETPPLDAFLLIIMVIGVIGWARPARLIRGAVLSAKEQRYVLAARGFGASDAYLLYRHVLPQALGIVVTQAGILIPNYILAEVTLSYLGLGMPEPVPSLGNMLAELNITSLHWWMLLPGVALVPVLWGYYCLTDALHERAGLVQT